MSLIFEGFKDLRMRLLSIQRCCVRQGGGLVIALILYRSESSLRRLFSSQSFTPILRYPSSVIIWPRALLKFKNSINYGCIELSGLVCLTIVHFANCRNQIIMEYFFRIDHLID